MNLSPLYDGSARYRPEPGPVSDFRYKDLAFASFGEGLGVNVLTGQHYRVGVALTYDLGRPVSSDYTHLQGLGDVQPAPETKVFAEYVVSKSFPLVLRADLRRQWGGANGVTGDIGAYLPLPGSSQSFQWFAGPTVTAADATYMRSYFGVGIAQALHSDYPQYHAAAGLKSFGFGLSAFYFFNQHWLTTASAALSQLVASAARSPITQARTNAVVDLSLTYQF